MADSSWLNNRLSLPDYNNWVKGNLILRELKTGLVPFLDDKVRDLQQHVLRNVAVSGTVCTVCTGDDLRRGRYICPSAGFCTTILQDINKEYIHHPQGLVKLMNTDSKAWCDTARYWETAKAYICTSGYDSKKSAAETDCVGLLTIILNCKWIHSFLSSLGAFQQVKDLRNAIMHSEYNTLEADELDDLYDGCIQILQDIHCIAVDSTAQAALARITEIKNKTLSISDINVPRLLFIVEELKSEEGKPREAIGHLEKKSENLEVWQKELEKQQTEQKQDILQLDTTVSELGTTVSLLDTTVSLLDTTVSQLGKRVRCDHEEHQQDESQLGKRVRDHHEEHQQDVSQLGITVSKLYTTVSLLVTTLSLHDTRLLRLEARNRTDNIQMTKDFQMLESIPSARLPVSVGHTMPVDFISYLLSSSPPTSNFELLSYSFGSDNMGWSSNQNGFSRDPSYQARTDGIIKCANTSLQEEDYSEESETCSSGSITPKRSQSPWHKDVVLTTVRIMRVPSDMPPKLGPEVLSSLTEDASASVTGTPPFELKFSQPASDYLSFREKVENRMVSLENVILKDYNVMGTVKVKNISFEKDVFIRCTVNGWETTKDILCTYVPGPGESTSHSLDTFSFEMDIDPNFDPNKSIEFAVCYSTPNGQFWDNNNGANYKIMNKESLSIPI